MITNERQYRSAISAIRSFEDAIATVDLLELIKSGVDPVIAKAQITSYELQLQELVEQVKLYDTKRAGLETNFPFSSVSEVGEHLIGCRVARSWTQRKLADVLGLKEQQVQRYERDRYSTISLARLNAVAEALGVTISGTLNADREEVDTIPDFADAIDPSLYPLAEMNARGWLSSRLNLRQASEGQRKDALLSFFSQVDLREPARALHKKTAGRRSPESQAAMLAWQARILWLANQRKGLARPFSKIDAIALRELVTLSRRPDGPQAAIEFLLNHGVIVVIEPVLPKTKLDGAAMVLDGRFAVIGITARHDRLDNFWFVLLHELGHILLHWGPLLRQGFVDEEIEKAQDGFEREANDFARSAIVPDEAWNSSFVRYSKSADVLKEFAAKWSVHEALIAGRIRFERNDYKAFSDMVGSGSVKAALLDAGL
jgi:HTH-type transcriptional regulator / antitoxin HigA